MSPEFRYRNILRVAGAMRNSRLKIALNAAVIGVVVLGHTIGIAAEEEIPYSQARLIQTPYICSYQYDSSAGEPIRFEAKILGNDFIAIGYTELFGKKVGEDYVSYYARKNDVGYQWMGAHPSEGMKFNLTPINRFLKTVSGAPSEFGDGVLFAPPTPEASCKPISHIDIVIPAIPFQDATQFILDAAKEEVQNAGDTMPNSESVDTIPNSGNQ